MTAVLTVLVVSQAVGLAEEDDERAQLLLAVFGRGGIQPGCELHDRRARLAGEDHRHRTYPVFANQAVRLAGERSGHVKWLKNRRHLFARLKARTERLGSLRPARDGDNRDRRKNPLHDYILSATLALGNNRPRFA